MPGAIESIAGKARANARGYFAAAALMVGVAVAAALLPERARLGRWVPLHLGLAGGSVLAVSGATQFFLATLRAAPVPSPVLRRIHVSWHFLAVGLLWWGRAGPHSVALDTGGLMVVGSLAAAAAVLVWQSARSSARRYAGQVAASLAALTSAGAGSVLGWLLARGTVTPSRAYVAHVTLNVLGFLGILTLGTLPRFFPMMVRVRIGLFGFAEMPWLVVAAAVASVAVGSVAGVDWFVPLGAVLGAAGAALALVDRVWEWLSSRVRWEADATHVMAALAWYAGAWCVLAASRPALPRVVPSLVAGFAVQIFIAAWSYFVPALQPGSSSQRRVARKRISRWLPLRLAMLNVGAAAMLAPPPWSTAGWPLVVAAVVAFGAAAASASRGRLDSR